MKIFAFASTNVTNIWAGLGAGLWAVSKSDIEGTNKRRKTLAKNMPVGAFGILYCSATHSLTTPFVVYSRPDENRSETSVWDGEWVLPFQIKPLGSPRRSMHREAAKSLLPSIANRNLKHVDELIFTKGTQTFVPSEITDEDWSVLIRELAI